MAPIEKGGVKSRQEKYTYTESGNPPVEGALNDYQRSGANAIGGEEPSSNPNTRTQPPPPPPTRTK